ncbi:MAG: hypothetical protein RLZZ175_2615 [Bacteroidota bacterium]|jgi:AraC family transcriptional regulator of adaptative response/methylated-DNA-[protein]-cysteine methyltransferase
MNQQTIQFENNNSIINSTNKDITIEKINEKEYSSTINYQFYDSKFGEIIIASTSKGICYLMYIENENTAFDSLKNKFPNANFQNQTDNFHKIALEYLCNPKTELELNLHIKGSDFQINIWNILLDIPFGKTTTYGNIAQKINQPKASRAVGTAIGKNPIAYIIPCHRVIQNSGSLGGYMWGIARKSKILAWEREVESTEYGVQGIK